MFIYFGFVKKIIIFFLVFTGYLSSHRPKKVDSLPALTGHVSVESLKPAKETVSNLQVMSMEKSVLKSSIQIRLVTENDLLDLLCLDEQVTFEFFKRLYERYYADVFKDKNIEQLLRFKLAEDIAFFQSAVARQDLKVRTEVLFCAYDTEKKCHVGLIYAYQRQASKDVQLGLLLVRDNYRHQGVGKALVTKVFEYYKSVMDFCYVLLLHTGNEKTLEFYKKLGFMRTEPATFDFLNVYGVPYGVMSDEYRYENKGRMPD